MLATALLFASGAHAQSDVAEDARKYVQKAKVHYDLGEFDKAAEAYVEAYRIKTVPGLLFNIAQCYRQGGQYEKARHFYRSYLREAPDAKAKSMVEAALKEVEDLLSRDRKTRDAEPRGLQPSAGIDKGSPEAARPPSAEPPPIVVVSAPPAAKAAEPRPAPAPPPPKIVDLRPAPAPTDAIKPPAPPKPASDDEASSPVYTKWWAWTAVGVVVVGAGVFAATSGGNSAPSAALGTAKVF